MTKLKIINESNNQKSIMNRSLKYMHQMMGTLTVALSLLGYIANNAFGSITISFAEVGGDVIATTSGSYV